MRSDGATAVDVQVHPQHLRLGRSQTNFALEAIESARPERNESQWPRGQSEMNRSVVALAYRWRGSAPGFRSGPANKRRHKNSP